MKEIIDMLILRRNRLDKLESVVIRRLQDVPDGQLRISSRNGNLQFYCRSCPSDRTGKYIKKGDTLLPAKLAQKEYDIQVLRAIKKEKQHIDKLIDSSSSLKAEEIYNGLNDKRKKLVVPVEETTEDFVVNWLSVSYEPKDFKADDPQHYSNSGLRVRSKSEVLIADTFAEEHIPFRYEYPLILFGLGEVRPDFVVLNIRTRQEFIWEHFGKMNDNAYYDSTAKKLYYYERNGYYLGENLIATWESSDFPLNVNMVKEKINKYLR